MWTLRRLHLLTVLTFAAMTSQAYAATPVMILGVPHFVSRRDVHNAVFTDSPLSPRRQAQVSDVIAHLVRFRPTKVLIEAPYQDVIWQERYTQYLAGSFSLTANEIYQFGFRLAKASGNRSIYPIDTFGPSLVDDNSAAGKRIDQFLSANFTTIHSPPFDAMLLTQNNLERNGTYIDLLRFLNTDEAVQANASWYSVFAGEGRDADQAGASYVAQWYTRNTYIYANILSVIGPGDRVVVVMGQGHKYLLSQFIKLNPQLTYVDALDYLR